MSHKQENTCRLHGYHEASDPELLGGPKLKGTCLSGDVQSDPSQMKKESLTVLGQIMHWSMDCGDIVPEVREAMVSWEPLRVISTKYSQITD